MGQEMKEEAGCDLRGNRVWNESRTFTEGQGGNRGLPVPHYPVMFKQKLAAQLSAWLAARQQTVSTLSCHSVRI